MMTMSNRLERESAYVHSHALTAEIPPELRNSELLKRESWLDESAVLKRSFYDSSGRQYGQLGPLMVHAADLQEREAPIDWDVINSNEPFEVMEYWKLPDSHPMKPYHTGGLVPASLRFWWSMQTDALRWRTNPYYLLPNRRAVEARFVKYGAPLYVTSSTTEEELAGLEGSVSVFRDNPNARTATSDELADMDRDAQLKVGSHWQAHRRPRRDKGDPHEIVLRTSMLNAQRKSPDQYTTYDHVVMKYVNSFERLATATSEELATNPELARTHQLHSALIELYNDKHEGDEIEFIHRPTPRDIEERESADRPAPHPLGVLGVASTVEPR
jgi:hypothetical protein